MCIFFGSVAWAGVVGTICSVLTTTDPATRVQAAGTIELVPTKHGHGLPQLFLDLVRHELAQTLDSIKGPFEAR